MHIGQSAYCLNCQQLLDGCKNTFLSMQAIHDAIRRRNLPFVPSLYRYLGMTLIDGMQNFADLVLEGKNRFEEYNSLEIQLSFENNVDNVYQFHDNFREWINNEIPAVDVEFKPTAIIHCTNSMTMYPAVRASSQWSYDKTTGVLYNVWTNFRLHYFTQYPMITNMSGSTEQTPFWSEDSGVYLVQDPDLFIDQVSYCVLKRIAEYSSLINMEGFNSQMKLDGTIKRLEERVEENRLKSSNLYAKWRNR